MKGWATRLTYGLQSDAQFSGNKPQIKAGQGVTAKSIEEVLLGKSAEPHKAFPGRKLPNRHTKRTYWARARRVLLYWVRRPSLTLAAETGNSKSEESEGRSPITHSDQLIG
jgi:hypothetical protein